MIYYKMNIDFFDKYLSVSWLYEKVFWKLLPDLVYNQTWERYKKALFEIYWYKDIYNIFNKELLKGDTIDLIKIVFKYQDNFLKSDVETPKNNPMNT